MGRNDSCFCGSGKKIKKCHSMINENSMVADVYRAYAKTDRVLKERIESEGVEPICGKGCYKCCHHYFNISEAEILTILEYIVRTFGIEKLNEYLEKGYNHWEEVKIDNPEFAREDSKNKSGYFDEAVFRDQMREDYLDIPEKTSSPCVFLNEDTKLCDVYPVRPIICRIHGVSHLDDGRGIDYVVCEEIPSYWEARDRMVYGVDLCDESSNLSFIDRGANLDPMFFRPHSIASFLSHYYNINKDIPFTETDTYKVPIEQTRNQLIQRKMEMVSRGV